MSDVIPSDNAMKFGDIWFIFSIRNWCVYEISCVEALAPICYCLCRSNMCSDDLLGLASMQSKDNLCIPGNVYSGGTYFLTSSQVWRNLTARFCYKIHQRCIKMNKWNIESKKRNNQDTAGNSSPFFFAYSVYTPVFINSVGLRIHINYKKNMISK